MNVLILGGTKYVGLGLAKYMQIDSCFPQVFTLSNKKLKNKNHFYLDRNNIKGLETVLLDFKPDIVIDFICYSKNDIKIILDLYNKGSLKTLQHYIVISTFFVYNYFSLNNFREKKLKHNNKIEKIRDTYTRNKIEMEILLSRSKLFDTTSIIRLPFIFSWDDYTKRFQALCENPWNNEIENSRNLFKFSMINKQTAIEGITKLIKLSPMGIIDLSNIGCLNLEEISKIINHKKNISRKKIFRKHTTLPYMLKNNICLNSKKIIIKKKLSEAIEEEAEIYFKKKIL